MDIDAATAHYETWLARRLTLLGEDIEAKHRAMADSNSAFPFFRATFYRWAQIWPEVCPAAARAPALLAVGDLHVENFGTWRDIDGRLVWGVNDFDEAHPMPYTIDLVRLATSVGFASEIGDLGISPADAGHAILTGYEECLEAGGAPFVLAERHAWLRPIAISHLRDPVAFWEKLDALPLLSREAVPAGARAAIEALWPQAGIPYDVRHRRAGLGSLGRQRFLGLAQWRGGRVAREAKALAPSAWTWAQQDAASTEIHYQTALTRAVRCPDPYVELRGHWIVRRLAPDCSRIELSSLLREGLELRLLHAMGWETANVHLGSPDVVDAVREDLQHRPAGWLAAAAMAMQQVTGKDWKEWRKNR